MKYSKVEQQLDALFEELILLDEVAGQLSPADNARIDQRRREVREQINELREQLKK